MAARAGGEQPDLRLFDAVLRLTSLAVHAVVQRLRLARQVGHDKARVAALIAPLVFSAI